MIQCRCPLEFRVQDYFPASNLRTSERVMHHTTNSTIRLYTTIEHEHLALQSRLWLAGLLAILLVAGVFSPLQAAPRPFPAALIGCEERVVNGGFETENAFWTLSSGVHVPSYESSLVFEGARSMRLGNVDLADAAVDSYVAQAISLPGDANYIVISFQYYPYYDNTLGAGDLQYFELWDSNTNTFISRPLQMQRNDRTWLLAQYDLAALRGRNIQIRFGARNDGANGRIAMYVDRISVIACNGTPGPSPTPTATGLPPTATPTPTSPAATATAVPGAPSGNCDVILLNGDFETDSNWICGADPVPGTYAGAQKYTGLRSMQLGNPPGYRPDVEAYSSARQLITISSSSTVAQLRWFHFYQSQEPPTDSPSINSDRQELILLNPDLSTLAVLHRVRRTDGGFLEEVVDLTPYRGRSFYVYFNVFNDGNGQRTWMWLDNARVFVCYPDGLVFEPLPLWTPSPTPMPLPSPTATPTPLAMSSDELALAPLPTISIPEIFSPEALTPLAPETAAEADAGSSATAVDAPQAAADQPSSSARQSGETVAAGETGAKGFPFGTILVLGGILLLVAMLIAAMIRGLRR